MFAISHHHAWMNLNAPQTMTSHYKCLLTQSGKDGQLNCTVFPQQCNHPYRQELITDDGLVWKGHRVIIPETLRLEYMQTVHGVILEPNLPNNMHVAFNFWPTMTKDIDTYIILCHMQQHQTRPAKRTPSAAWSSKPAMVNSSS